jgi:hypothetical protein
VGRRRNEYPITNTQYPMMNKGLPLRQTASATSPKQGRSTLLLIAIVVFHAIFSIFDSMTQESTTGLAAPFAQS